jgi:similar to stage IV sporulation protein
LQKRCAGSGVEVGVERSFGLPYFCYRHRKRAGIFLGTLLSVILMFLSQRFVWDVRVTGNDTMTESEVIEELSACGFGVGSYIPGFRAGELENRVLISSDKIAWISIYLDGTVATVQVVEHGTAPPAEDVSKPANLVAAFDGQIETLELYRGSCLVTAGQAVKKGDLLVSGIYDSQTQGMRYTRASGKVFARAWQRIRVEIPFRYEEKVYGEAQRGDVTLNFFGFSTKILKSTGNLVGSYDIIEDEKEYALGNGCRLPFSVVRTYATKTVGKTVVYKDGELISAARNRMEESRAQSLSSCEVLRISSSGSLTEDGYRLSAVAVVIASVGSEVFVYKDGSVSGN